jgi:hypothetical protein
MNLVRGVYNGFKRILFNGFDQNQSQTPITWHHLNPCTQWNKVHSININGFVIDLPDIVRLPIAMPPAAVDAKNGDKYCSDSPGVIRLKCLALTASTLIPVLSPVALSLNLINRAVKVLSFAHFWYSTDNPNDSFWIRSKEWGKDVLRIIFTPIILVGLLLAAIYGLIRPEDGRKLFATQERFIYGTYGVAPCFQPSPKEHLLGGDINQPNQW